MGYGGLAVIAFGLFVGRGRLKIPQRLPAVPQQRFLPVMPVPDNPQSHIAEQMLRPPRQIARAVFSKFATRVQGCDFSRIFGGTIRISQPTANCVSGRRDGCPVPSESVANQPIPVGFRA